MSVANYVWLVLLVVNVAIMHKTHRMNLRTIVAIMRHKQEQRDQLADTLTKLYDTIEQGNEVVADHQDHPNTPQLADQLDDGLDIAIDLKTQIAKLEADIAVLSEPVPHPLNVFAWARPRRKRA